MSNYDDPATYFNPADNLDRLLFFSVVDYRTDYKGYDDGDPDRDGVEVLVTVLDGPDAGTEYLQSTIHQGQLVKTLKGKKGSRLLGVLTKGEKKGKFQAPYIITRANEEQRAVADAYLAASQEPPF